MRVRREHRAVKRGSVLYVNVEFFVAVNVEIVYNVENFAERFRGESGAVVAVYVETDSAPYWA